MDRPLIRRTSVLMFPRSHGLAGEETGFVIAVDDSARKLIGDRTGLDDHPECRGGQVGALPGIDGPPDHAAGVGVEHAAAVELPLTGGVLGDAVTHSWFGPS